MEPQNVERRLTTILAADIVGYSRLMGLDEAGTLSAITKHRDSLINPKTFQYAGRIVKHMGDGTLMEFASVVDAVAFAVEVQCAMKERNAEVPEDRQIVYRIGINVGDIIVKGDDIYGDGVNVASRLEGLAEPGGICIRRNVRNQVRDKLDLNFEDLGEVEVKNIARPIRVFRVVLDEKAEALATPVVHLPVKAASSRLPQIAAGLALSLLAIGGLVWWQSLVPDVEPASLERMALPLPDKPSLAVLPFDNMSGDEEQEYFADGFSELLITELARDRELFVIARNSSFTFKDKPVEVRQVAEKLGVRYVIEGSIQRSADKVRITAQLVDAIAGNHVWADRYDRPAKDLFAVQDEIVSSIVATVRGFRGPLQVAETNRQRQSPTEDLGAYDLVLRSIMHKDRFTKEDNKIAHRLLRQAIDRDPNFASAHAWQAWIHAVDVWLLFTEDAAASIEAGYEEARRALVLDPNLDVAHWALATIHALAGKRAESIASYDKALQLNPNNADVMAESTWLLCADGKADLAVTRIEKAMRLNPQFPDWYLWGKGATMYYARRYEDAVAALNRMTSHHLDSHLWLAMSYAQLGQTSEAKVHIAEALKLNPEASIHSMVEVWKVLRPSVRAHYEEGLRLAGLPE